MFLNILRLKKKYIDYNLLLEEVFALSGNTINILKKYSDLYNFWHDLLLHSKNLNEIKLEQIDFLEDLMNSGGFEVYPNISKPKKELKYKAESHYLLLLGNPNKAFVAYCI